MPTYFPRQTVQFSQFEEPSALRKLSFSLVEMAVITGVLLRIYRSVVLTHGSNSWLYLGGSFALGLVFLFAMLTAHLANFTLRRWVRRAPLFAVVEVATEGVMSLLLIALGREPNGTVRATFGDWAGLIAMTTIYRFVMIAAWTLILAAAVTIARRMSGGDADDDAAEDAMAAAMEARRSGSSGSQVMH